MKRIFLAAGHYPAKPGACYKGYCEHDEAVLWTESFQELLGERVVVIPPGTLQTKADYINARVQPGDVAIEIHFNSFVKAGEHVGKGCVTLFYPGSSNGMALADVCQSAMASCFEPSRGCKEGWYRGKQERGAYFFLEKTRCPAVILEPQFIHLKESIVSNRAGCCFALATALTKYLGDEDGLAHTEAS